LTLYEEALSIFSRDGVRNEVIQARIGLAEVARFEGRLAEAETAYLAALTLQRSMGDRSLSVTRCNLALVAIAQDRFDAARTQLELAETEMIQAGQKGMLVYVQVLLLACVAAAGEKAQWERQLAAATRSLDETGTIDLDLARVLERAGSLMAEKGLSARARDAWRLALRQFEGLEDGRGVARVTDLLETSSN
jgi:tetratricopeptide (TPR) repeat protein